MSSSIFSLLDTPAYGGAEEYLLTVLFHLQKKGYRVVLATNNQQVKNACSNKIKVINLPYRLDAIGNWKGLVKYFIALPGAILWLIKTLRGFETKSICLFPGFTDRLSFSPFVKWLGCPLIWLEYGPLEPTFARNHGFPKLLYMIGRPFPDTIVTISKWTKKSLIKVGKIPKEKIHIIYPGVTIPAQSRSQPVKKNQFLVATVARLATEKEIDVLLRAWVTVQIPDKRLVIIGDGPERQSLEKLTQTLLITDSVEFVGFVSEEMKRVILSQSDLFVFPGAWSLEGFGMTTIEAMSVGVPVISSGYGPQSEIVQDGENGWIFIPHDSESLALKIEEVFNDPHRKDIAKAGQEKVKNVFSRGNMLKQFEELLSSLQSE